MLKWRKTNGSISYRITAAFILAAAAALIYSLRGPEGKDLPDQKVKNIAATAAELDREIDSVLAEYNIEKSQIRVSQYTLPESDLCRTERRISAPPGILPLLVNRSINIIARRYDARAIGSENLKEKSVNIHIKTGDFIVHSLIFRSVSGRGPADKNLINIKPKRKKTG